MSKKIVIITGGNRGIGSAAAEEFLAQNHTVYSISRHPSAHPDVISIEADVRDTSTIKEAFLDIYKQHDKIDVLVNNAGIMEDALIGMISADKMLEQFQINVFSTIELTQLAVRFMKRKKSGCIVNVASIIGTNGNAGQSVYSATKGAVISFTKSAAKELSPYGIRVNAVAPGIIDTSLIQNVPPAAMQKRISQIGMGRVGTPEEIGKAIFFLSSENASYISGQVLGIDGCAIL